MINDVILGVIIGGLIGIVGQLVGNYLDYKNSIKRINHEIKLKLFLEVAKDLEKELKAYLKLLNGIKQNKRIEEKDIKDFKTLHKNNEMKENTFKIYAFKKGKINEEVQGFYMAVVAIENFLEKKEFNKEKIEKLQQTLMHNHVLLEKELKKELSL